MFFTVPSESDYIQTTTPIGVKSIRAVFFESKNDALFEYKRTLDKISIIIDGKQICRDLIVLPFMTSVPYGNRRHKWYDVALNVNLNVNLSEIKISGIKSNDFNIVFVCSDKEVDESKGFDFVETKQLRLKGKPTGQEARQALERAFRLLDEMYEEDVITYNAYQTALASYNVALAEYTAQTEAHAQWQELSEAWTAYNNYEAYITAYGEWETAHQAWVDGGEEGEEPQQPVAVNPVSQPAEALGEEPVIPEVPTAPDIVEEPQPSDEVTINGIQYSRSHYWFNGQQYETIPTAQISKYIANNSNGETTYGNEFQFVFDHEPTAMFFYPIMTANGIDRVLNSDIHVNFTISGTDNEMIPNKTDLLLFSATDKIPFRKAIFNFDEPIKRNISFVVSKKADMVETACGMDISNFDLYVLFIYKKVC